jgi:hypothetical protein
MRLSAAANGGVTLTDDRALVLAPSVVELDDGVVVWVDPLEPGSPWCISALEPDSGPVIELLLGSEAAERVRDAYWSVIRGARVEPREVAARPCPAWRDVARLGFLLWLEQNAVGPLAQADLDLEIAIVAARLAPLGAADLSRGRFIRAAPQLRRLAVAVRDGADAPPVADVVVEGIDSYLRDAAGDLPDPVIADLQQLADASRSIAEAGGATGIAVPDSLLDSLLDSFQRASSVARGSSAGSDDRSFSVDWEEVARGVLDPGEGTVVTHWDPTASVLAVSVLGAHAANPARNLLFRVQRADESRPTAVGALSYDEPSGSYRGASALDRPLAVDDRVDVTTTGWRTSVALGDEAALRRARRSAAWAVAFERQAVASGPVAPGALGAAQQAWFDAADGLAAVGSTAADACQSRARRIGELRTEEARAAWVRALPSATLAERMVAARAGETESIGLDAELWLMLQDASLSTRGADADAVLSASDDSTSADVRWSSEAGGWRVRLDSDLSGSAVVSLRFVSGTLVDQQVVLDSSPVVLIVPGRSDDPPTGIRIVVD